MIEADRFDTESLPETPLQILNDPLFEQHAVQVSLLRLDQIDPLLSGNKYFKLLLNLQAARQQGITRLVSFGGAWSNHLHALAAAGRRFGFETIGIVRGHDAEQNSDMLQDARRWGMRLEAVSRTDYRRRNDEDFLGTIRQRFAPCMLIPEGGANRLGVAGCRLIAGQLSAQCDRAPEAVVLACGTGGTLAGLVAGMPEETHITGISVLKNAAFLTQSVTQHLFDLEKAERNNWQIELDYHRGGYARVDDELKRFIEKIHCEQGVILDPVYTGKMLLALYDLISRGRFSPGSHIVAIHTGGVQGLRGFADILPAVQKTMRFN